MNSVHGLLGRGIMNALVMFTLQIYGKDNTDKDNKNTSCFLVD